MNKDEIAKQLEQWKKEVQAAKRPGQRDRAERMVRKLEKMLSK